MNILITGGAGFVGSNLIEYFAANTNYKILSIDNYSSGNKKNHIKSKRIMYVRGNTINISLILKKYIKEIVVIFHFGEFSRIAQSFIKFDFCLDSNIEGTNN
ncbi:MAG: NAD(P)-dependent oxidoreductase, partial [Candidatus Pelagibacter sp. TMED153]